MLKGINHDQRNSLAQHNDRHTHKYTQLRANWDLNWRRVRNECLKGDYMIYFEFLFIKIFLGILIYSYKLNGIFLIFQDYHTYVECIG